MGHGAAETSSNDQRFTHIAVSNMVRDFMSRKAPRLTAYPPAQAFAAAGSSDREAILKGLKRLRRLLVGMSN